MNLQDMKWTLNRIVGLKCCVSCKRYRRKDCRFFYVMSDFVKQAEERIADYSIEFVGSRCLDWE